MQTSDDQNDAYLAVVSDLVGLIEHVQNGLRLIEQMIAKETLLETSVGTESSTNVIVLDDISPRYVKAAAALQACDVNLGTALRALQNSDGSDASRPTALGVIGV
jgi:hypothetical protein